MFRKASASLHKAVKPKQCTETLVVSTFSWWNTLTHWTTTREWSSFPDGDTSVMWSAAVIQALRQCFESICFKENDTSSRAMRSFAHHLQLFKMKYWSNCVSFVSQHDMKMFNVYSKSKWDASPREPTLQNYTLILQCLIFFSPSVTMDTLFSYVHLLIYYLWRSQISHIFSQPFQLQCEHSTV